MHLPYGDSSLSSLPETICPPTQNAGIIFGSVDADRGQATTSHWPWRMPTVDAAVSTIGGPESRLNQAILLTLVVSLPTTGRSVILIGYLTTTVQLLKSLSLASRRQLHSHWIFKAYCPTTEVTIGSRSTKP
jgi:hypothetical protein